MEHRFQVDLRGIVDLLSHHLYASPRVFARELLQNAVDAVAARRAVDPHAPAGRIVVETLGDGGIRVHDNGVGLTEAQVHEFLASVGSTSKRDELGFARQDFLGQFGIGLLSCFMVADPIEVTTRSVTGAPAVRWTGYGDGRYAIEVDAAATAQVGTTVTLRPRTGAEHWLSQIGELARTYAHLLDIEIVLQSNGEPVRITQPQAPWEIAFADRDERRSHLLAYGQQLLGSRPMEVIDLAVAEAGLTGLAFVLPSATKVGGGGHRVYLKRMLLSESAEKLLPPWAFFLRCVVNTTQLRPTASREALYEDDLLSVVQESIGEQVRRWLLDLSVSHPDRLAAFLRVHGLGVRALAISDDDMLNIVDMWLPAQTSRGIMPLSAFRAGASTIRYVETDDEFRTLAPIASAIGTPIVNACHAYDIEILERLASRDKGLTVRRLDVGELAARLEPLPTALAATLAPFLAVATQVLAPLGCEPLLRQFDPVALPALYLVSQESRDGDALRRGIDGSDELWAQVISSMADVKIDHRPSLILNWRHPLIRRLAGYPGTPALRHAIEALYGQALLAGHHPLRSADSAALNRSFLALLDIAFAEAPTTPEPQ